MENPLLSPKYNCSQGELYSVCEIGWRSYQNNLSVFSAWKAFYDAPYGEAAIAEIEAAIRLPDLDTRVGEETLLRLQLADALLVCGKDWQLLKSYMGTAYKGEVLKTKLKMAGNNYYTRAMHQDWEKCRLLMTAGSNFITENSADLTNDNNMPASFITEFEDDFNTFKTLYTQFKETETKAMMNTQAKMALNNLLYEKTISMFKDGKIYFSKNPAIKQQFVFDTILKLVSSAGNAGLSGTILNAKTGQGLEGASLSLFEGTNVLGTPKYTTTTEANGGFDFGNTLSGDYTLKMDHAGFVSRQETVVIEAGVVGNKTFMMNE